MPRPAVTLAQAIAFDFDQLTTLVTNLLVKNKNFDSGYYFREYPSTSAFVRNVLKEHAEAIAGRIAQLKDTVVENLEEEPWTEARVETLRAEFEERVFGQYFLSTIVHTGLGGCCELMSKDAKHKDEFVARMNDGSYVEETLNAAWWAYKAAHDVPRELAPNPSLATVTSIHAQHAGIGPHGVPS